MVDPSIHRVVVRAIIPLWVEGQDGARGMIERLKFIATWQAEFLDRVEAFALPIEDYGFHTESEFYDACADGVDVATAIPQSLLATFLANLEPVKATLEMSALVKDDATLAALLPYRERADRFRFLLWPR